MTCSQIITPDVTGLLKHDRLFAHRWKLDVEIREVSQLLCFLRCKIHNEEVHPVVPVRNEIDLVVRSPHRADVLRWIVREVFGCAGFEIVKPNVIRHAAAIMFPSSELAEDAV